MRTVRKKRQGSSSFFDRATVALQVIHSLLSLSIASFHQASPDRGLKHLLFRHPVQPFFSNKPRSLSKNTMISLKQKRRTMGKGNMVKGPCVRCDLVSLRVVYGMTLCRPHRSANFCRHHRASYDHRHHAITTSSGKRKKKDKQQPKKEKGKKEEREEKRREKHAHLSRANRSRSRTPSSLQTRHIVRRSYISLCERRCCAEQAEAEGEGGGGE